MNDSNSSLDYCRHDVQLIWITFTLSLSENKRKKEMIENLKSRGYASDPVKAWKQSLSSNEEEEGSDQEEGEEGSEKGQPDYNYLLSMQLWSLTREKKEELLKNRDKKAEELRILQGKTPKDLWKEDIEAFLEEFDVGS